MESLASINLWELITEAAAARNQDRANFDHATKILEACAASPAFATELSLTISKSYRGNCWTITLFEHNEPFNKIELTVAEDGYCTVSRTVTKRDMMETRSISF